MTRPTPKLFLCGLVLLWTMFGCDDPFGRRNYLGRPITPEELHQIDAVLLRDKSITPPTTVEQASSDMLAHIAESRPAEVRVDLSIDEVRAAALQSNLDLKVEVFNPALAQADVDAERAKFEWAFTASYRHVNTDNPTALGTEGSQGKSDAWDMGVNIPLSTGGTARVNVPFNETSTNNPFSLLNPAYQADLRFSISQPLLRNAGVNVNRHSIRLAEYEAQATDARTKLEAIRILADADRAYWRLYASRRELQVRQEQYDLAVKQRDSAKRKLDAGDVAEIELTRADSGVASSLQDIIIAQTALRRTQRDLKRIMQRSDLPMNGVTEIVLATQPEPLGLKLDADALSDFAVTNRMEMLELELQLAMDASTIDFRRNQKMPLFTLDYTYNINGLGSSYGRAFDQIPDNRFADWIVGVNAEIPLGNEQAKARYHQAVLQRLQRLATRGQRDTAIRQEVADALDQLDQTWQRILAARQSVILAGRTYDGETRQFNLGLRTSTDVQDALTRLSDARSQEVLALTQYQIAQIDIAFATGTLLGTDRVEWTPAADIDGAPAHFDSIPARANHQGN